MVAHATFVHAEHGIITIRRQWMAGLHLRFLEQSRIV
jgi:hypothetical protein